MFVKYEVDDHNSKNSLVEGLVGTVGKIFEIIRNYDVVLVSSCDNEKVHYLAKEDHPFLLIII